MSRFLQASPTSARDRIDRKMLLTVAVIVVVLAAAAFVALGNYGYLTAFLPAGQDEPLLETVELPKGFTIESFATGVEGARSMTWGEEGTLFVGSRGQGNVYALVDRDGDWKADEVLTIASGLNSPNGVAFREGALYVAEISRILRFDDIESRLKDPPEPIVVRDDFPKETHHGWKYIAFGPDGLLYVPVGAPCNVCQPEEEIFASITRMKPDGSEREIFAHGVRNTVGFDWHPETKELWFTDNGRDWMGDDRPPDELNRAPEPGLHFGFPHCHGKGIPDPEHNEGRDCSGFVPPERELGPHVAALGMIFYTGEQFPKQYRGKIFIAEHGSWNRSTPIGYRVMMVDPQQEPPSYEVFAKGWLQDAVAWGRPVDVLQAPDGSLLVSDDKANAIYRISYESSGG